MPVLKVENLIKIFGSEPRKALELLEKGATRKEILEKTGQTLGVANINFEVEEGEILVIMGLSGSGKSTLVRCVNRLIEPTSGKIYIDGEDVTAMDQKALLQLRRKKLAMVFQGFALFPNRTVIENAMFGLEIMEVPEKERREKAQQALELVGLAGWEDSYGSQLSGGMKQRVGLARALAVDPEIILMDEALSALDPLIRTDMQNELISLQRKLGKTFLFITHDLDEAINMGDRIILMRDGVIVQSGTAEEILTNPGSEYVARFVENVDMAKVLTAGTVMKKVGTVAHLKDGPKTLLRKMKESGHSNLFVVGEEGTLRGVIKAADASEAAKLAEGGQKKVASDLMEEARSVEIETPVGDIFALLAENKEPLAVVDENSKLKGVVVTGMVLAGMAGLSNGDQENK